MSDPPDPANPLRRAGFGSGERFARFRLLRVLGQGSTGSVHLAQPLGRPDDDAASAVALKIVPLPPAAAEAAAAAEAFLRSARLARGLAHPDIVAVRDAGIEGAFAWLAMEPVPGCDLQRYTGPRRLLPERVTLEVGARLARALAYAHARGIVHRDLKPANVLLHWPARVVKLTDFGIARAADSVRTDTGVVPGTPLYMAPELLAGALPAPAADLYALGVLLFELLTGARPHEAASMGELLRQVAGVPAPPLRSRLPAAPAALEGLLAALLERRADARPPDGEAVARVLEAVLAAWP